ncbi:thiamine pyrophosphate-binding protein [Acrocarpospora sp. B8E8]|uniref:thiamine pyrophosphate-binding protein n=1 Tax=Acrocarpospora sp. B8E8 TaxID=3153572 RepID=UPI00325DDCE3
MTTAAQVLAATIRAYGVDPVFGIPGTHNLAIYQALAEAGVRCVTTRHEQGAGYAADGYARATGRPGVVLTTTGPAVLNAAAALAQAYSDSSPVLLISPGVPLTHPRLGRGYLHESKDQSRALDSLCAWSHRVTSPEEIPAALSRAFASFTEGRPRPIHLEIPVDLLDLPTSVPPATPFQVPPRAPDPTAIASAATLLGTALRPAIVLGGGVHHSHADHSHVHRSRAGTLALTLAERTGAPVVTTANGKAAVPESHPLALGATLHLPAVQTWLATCDVVLAIGTELAPSDFWIDDFRLTGHLIRIDVDPAQMHGDHPATIPIVADAFLALNALLIHPAIPQIPEHVPREPLDAESLAERRDSVVRSGPDAEWLADRPESVVRAGWDAESLADRPESVLQAGLDAESLAGRSDSVLWAQRDAELEALAGRWGSQLKAVRDVLPADTIVTADSSMFCYYGALGGLPVDPPGRFLYPTGFGTLGFALPAAIGAKIAYPERPVAVLAGDGAFQFSVQELATAVELGLPLPIVISVNGGYGEIRAEMVARGMSPVAVDLHNPDFVGLAVAYGAGGVAVDTPEELGEAVGKALHASGPTVIVLREA